MEFPSEQWRQNSSNSFLERLNKKSNRRSRVAGCLPDEESLIRLIGLCLPSKMTNERVPHGVAIPIY